MKSHSRLLALAVLVSLLLAPLSVMAQGPPPPPQAIEQFVTRLRDGLVNQKSGRADQRRPEDHSPAHPRDLRPATRRRRTSATDRHRAFSRRATAPRDD